MSRQSTGEQSKPIIVRLAGLARAEIGPQEFFGRFMRLVQAGLRADGGNLWLYDRENRQLAPRVKAPEEGPLSALGDDAVTRAVYSALEQEKPVLYSPDETVEHASLQELSLAIVPVELDEKTAAVVLLARRKGEDNSFTADEVHTLQSLTAHLSAFYGNFRARRADDVSKRLAKLAEIEGELAGVDRAERMAFTLANRVREMLFFNRTFVALPTGSGFRIAAVSGVDDVPQKGAAVQNLRDLVREVNRIGGAWSWFYPQ